MPLTTANFPNRELEASLSLFLFGSALSLHGTSSFSPRFAALQRKLSTDVDQGIQQPSLRFYRNSFILPVYDRNRGLYTEAHDCGLDWFTGRDAFGRSPTGQDGHQGGRYGFVTKKQRLTVIISLQAKIVNGLSIAIGIAIMLGTGWFVYSGFALPYKAHFRTLSC